MRPTLDEYYLKMLTLVASRSTCPRRQVGAIITNERGKIISTGVNGVPSGIYHCSEHQEFRCLGALDKHGDTSRCRAIHAEQNAILQAGGRFDGDYFNLYCSATPCFSCSKLVCNTPIMRIICLELYADVEGISLFVDTNRDVQLASYKTGELRMREISLNSSREVVVAAE